MGSSFIEEIKRFEPTVTKQSWGRKWEPRTKTVTCLISTFIVISLEEPLLLFFTFFMLLFAILTMGIGLKYVFSKLLILIPFLTLMSVPILFAQGFNIDSDRLLFVIQLNLKALSSVLLMIIMLLTQPMAQFLNGVANMRLPSAIVAILIMSLHYTRILYITLLSYQKALISRLFKPSSFHKQSLKVYSGVMAGLVLRSYIQSERASQAMVARGFDGTIPTSAPKPISKYDVFLSTIFTSFMILLIIIEKWWF
ncbi:energy-coupling factor transporter transmembrane component T family protein [Alkalihalobacterium elongatum]|uniref:energy-coupling factor transporter transmembrane component T family protein n=1 Tax=Alkalihalobacterium elongatum TaxID=2675466 RepID=UPI001C1F3CF9|nr:energy-coupling factor transporter transmembrane component T [Alkalihalobacterium elongatum]